MPPRRSTSKTNMPATDTLITLTGGFTIHTSVVLWFIEASFRLKFRIVDEKLEVFPRSAITAEDDCFIRAHRQELFEAVGYIDRLAEQPF